MYSCGVLKEKAEFISISYEILEGLKDAGIETIIFSIHGKPKTHDYITGLDGSFDITIQSIKKAIEKGFRVEIHSVPMNLNISDIPFVYQLAGELGVAQVSLLRLVPQGRLRFNRGLEMTKQDYNSLNNVLKSLTKTKVDLRTGSPFSCLMPTRINSCSAGKYKLLIGPNGDVYPCEAFKTKLKGKTSNIYKSTLEDIWVGDKTLNEIRNLNINQISGCNSCTNSHNCLGGCHGQRLITNDSLTIGPDPICNLK